MTIRWQTPLHLIDTDKPAEFLLGEDFAVVVDAHVYVAPAGMRTDGASIPRFAWRLIGPPLAGRYRRAAIIHDAAYQGVLERLDHEGNALPRDYSRKWADRLFRDLMRALRVFPINRWLIYRGVRLGGWLAWRKHRKH